MAAQTKWLRHRGVLVGAALLALVAASSAIAVWAASRLPAPEHARGRDLVRWLVTRDLRMETEETRRALVRQLEIYLQDTSELSAAAAEMDAERRWRLQENVAVLLPEWLRIATERFHPLEIADRPAYLDEQLLLLERVCQLSQLWNRSAEGSPDADPTLELVAIVEQVVVETPPDKRSQHEEFVRVMKLRWFATADLSQFNSRSLATLANHVEGELRGGFQLNDTEADFDPVGSRRLWKNADLLAEVWFHRQVATYSRVSPDARNRYMAQFVADVASWPLIRQRIEPAATANPAVANPFGLLLSNRLVHAMKQMSALEDRIEGWIRRAPPTSQPEMRKFVADARTALRNHYLKQLVTDFS